MRLLLRITLITLVFVGKIAFAEERKGKAVFEITKDNGMRLTDEALTNIEVEMAPVPSAKAVSLPSKSLIFFQDNVGAYRFRDGWFKLVPVKIVRKGDRFAEVQSAQLRIGDKIAIHGGDLLRVSELDALGGGE